MLGAIAGDIIGSVYEFNNYKKEDFQLFVKASTFTDDTVLTVAVADILLNGGDYTYAYREYFSRYPNRGYGSMFEQWARSMEREPYNSFGNGSAMRVSPVAYVHNDIGLVLRAAEESAMVTHNHPEGVKGAKAVAAAVFLARIGKTKDEIRFYVEAVFGYDLQLLLEDLRRTYIFNETCQGTVPPAIAVFLQSTDFEDCIRKAVSIGGDSDTIACIAGAIAHAFYKHIPEPIVERVKGLIDQPLLDVVEAFDRKFGVGV